MGWVGGLVGVSKRWVGARKGLRTSWWSTCASPARELEAHLVDEPLQGAVLHRVRREPAPTLRALARPPGVPRGTVAAAAAAAVAVVVAGSKQGRGAWG